MRVALARLAVARSGDKGEASNVGVMALSPAIYRLLVAQLTPERVKDHFSSICRGGVERHLLPGLLSLNFLLHDSLGGGGSASLRTDAQGKAHGLGLLRMEIEVPDDLPLPPP